MTPTTKIAELYGVPTSAPADWQAVISGQQCTFLSRRCLKNRKSEASITIGTCTMSYGSLKQPVMICPFRLLERSQIFLDCTHLLKLHEPGNELRIVAELSIPGGSVDYCLVLEAIFGQIKFKLPASALLTVGSTVPISASSDAAADEKE